MAIPSYLHSNPAMRWMAWRRVEVVAERLRRLYAEGRPGRTVVDFGCGTGVLFEQALRGAARVIGVDLVLDSARMLIGEWSLDVDLKETLKSYLQVFHSTSPGAAFPSLAGERSHNPELSKLLEPVTKGRREPFVRIFERARARGEIADDVDVNLAADLVVGPISVALFFRGRAPSPRMAGPIVDLALSGIAKRA